MINEHISEILKRDLIESTKRGVFSSPSEITAHGNASLEASYSTRTISVELQEIGWQKCGTSRAKRKHDNRASCYYWKQNRKQKALLTPSAQSQPDSSENEDGESLASINKRFRAAQADKERSLASTRSVETKSATHREKHLRLALERDRGELIEISEVQRVWNEALVYIKTGLYTLPSRFSERWASETDDGVIYDELVAELDFLCNKFAQEGEKVVTQNDEKKFNTDEVTDVENEAIG